MDYSEEIIQRVWEKGKRVLGYDATIMRKDELGSWILREHYRRPDSDFSWEIDCPDLDVKEGLEISSLRPLNSANRFSMDKNFFEKVMDLYGSNFMFR